MVEKNSKNKGNPSPSEQDIKTSNGFFGNYGVYLFIAGFLIYLAVLITGLIAEIFDIQTILDWWIWRPPGR